MWWHKLRYLHVLTWATVGALLIDGQVSRWAGVLIVFDILPGLLIRITQKQLERASVSEPADENVLMFRF